MRLLARCLTAMVGTIGIVTAAQAGDVSSHRGDTFEIAGFGGMTTGGQFKLEDGGAISNGVVTATGSRIGLDDHSSFAVAADLHASDSTAYEIFYSREASHMSPLNSAAPTDVTVSYLHFGGLYLLDDSDRLFRPYAIGGIGITRLQPGDAGSSRTRPSAALGLGLRWAATQHFALRLEGRGLVTLMNNNAVFCNSNDTGLICQVRANGTTFIQGQFLAGVAFVF